jgi:SAM-dependent methyltransferase
MTSHSYVGDELELFQRATNWKRYYGGHLAPHVSGDVLEVGAGIGGTSRFLCRSDQMSWTCLEPDTRLAARLGAAFEATPLPVRSRVVCGTIADLPQEECFDTILYIDVLEHIENEHAELTQAAHHLRPQGRLIVLAPAHNALYSAFDRAIGHFRRYNRRMLTGAAPSELRLDRAFYLDSVGMLASLANRALLRAEYPTASQIRFWDSTLVMFSRVVDPLCGYRIGKTVVGVWTRRN